MCRALMNQLYTVQRVDWKKTNMWLSCNDLPGLVGTMLLWKRRGGGSIAVRPHAPQRPRAAASINLHSISCALHSAYTLCLWLQHPHLPFASICAAVISSLSLNSVHTFQPGETNSRVLRPVFLSRSFPQMFSLFRQDVLKWQGHLEDILHVSAVLCEPDTNLYDTINWTKPSESSPARTSQQNWIKASQE